VSSHILHLAKTLAKTISEKEGLCKILKAKLTASPQH
jgi:hypothetical protein